MAFNKVTCGDHNQNLYCGCYDDRGSRVDQKYVQWNKESQKFVCCNKVDFSPTAITSGTVYNSVSKYLYDAGPSGTDVSDCDYTTLYSNGVSGDAGDSYMEINFPDIYYEGLSSMNTYSQFVRGKSKPTFIVNPTENQFTVSCPLATEFPYIINFNSSERPDNFPDYLTVCIENLGDLVNITSVDYSGNYFINGQGAECSQVNSCSLGYSPGNYNVIGNRAPFVINKPERKLAYGIVFGIFLVILVGVIVMTGIMFHQPDILTKYINFK